MGGAFGGKEVQANPWAAIAALGAWKTRRPVRVRLTRALDMALTGKRHPFLARYSAGFDHDGRLRRRSDLALLRWRLEPGSFRADPVARAVSLRQRLLAARTSNSRARLPDAQDFADGVPRLRRTAGHAGDRRDSRSGGAPAIACRRKWCASAISIARAITTHYGQPVKDAGRIETIWKQLKDIERVRPAARRDRRVSTHAHRHHKRGLAITPVKFGISFTATFFNQAGALVLIYRDGSVQVNHGGTEMGQGLHTKIQQIAADGLGMPSGSVRVMPTRTDKVPNTSATAASAGTDLNGAAVADACANSKQLAQVAAGCWTASRGQFPRGHCRKAGAAAFRSRRSAMRPIGSACRCSRRATIARPRSTSIRRRAGASRSTTSRTARRSPKWKWTASPATIACCARIFLQDVGDSVSPLVDRGQIEGGFMQGVGWLTLEELLWDAQGRLATAGASTYKLPSWSEMPEVFNVDFLERAAEPRSSCSAARPWASRR